MAAALLAEMQDVRGSACFENSETDFRHSRCVRQGGVGALVFVGRVAKHVLWISEEEWKARGWGLPFGDENDNEHVLRGVMWADHYWLFCVNKGRLVCMVNDIIQELLDMDRCGGQAIAKTIAMAKFQS